MANKLKTRCAWADSDELMRNYHDTEWGVPVRDGRALWEMLQLEGFQAGLSWRTILGRREAFRKAFKGFKPEVVARFGAKEVERLMQDEAIIRARAKIEATISNAKVYLEMKKASEDFAEFVWDFVGGKTIQNGRRDASEVPAKTELSEALSAALKKKGFKFVGPVITYAWMEAFGLVNDHVVGCFRHNQVKL